MDDPVVLVVGLGACGIILLTCAVVGLVKAFAKPVDEIRFDPCFDGRPPFEGATVPEGTCNSSHGGSCCACGGPLPLPHEHVEVLLHGDRVANGTSCSIACCAKWTEWAKARPKVIYGYLCPGAHPNKATQDAPDNGGMAIPSGGLDLSDHTS